MTREQFEVRCECGRVHDVTIGMCGITFPCVCGKDVRVPSSIKLREAAGLAAVVPEPEFVIREMVNNGTLPWPTCLACGIDAEPIHQWMVECQQQRAHSESSAPLWVWVLFSPWVFLVRGPFAFLGLAGRSAGGTEFHGRDVFVRTPVRICNHCHATVSESWLDAVATPAAIVLLGAGLMMLCISPIASALAVVGAGTLLVVRHQQNTQLRQTRRDCLLRIPEFRKLFRKYPDALITPES